MPIKLHRPITLGVVIGNRDFFPDSLITTVRDAFCGKISVCNNLYQYGIPFSLTSLHTEKVSSDAFKTDLQQFSAVCRVVKELPKARLGAVGARPNAFNTTRYSEKLLQAFGIGVSTIDLSEVFGRAEKLGDTDSRVSERIKGIKAYVPTAAVPSPALVKMAKLGIVIGEPDKCVLFHCGNWAKSFFADVKMANAEILAATLGTENTYGTVAGRTPAGPFGYARITTDDRAGQIRAYVGDGSFVDDPLDTFGSRAVVQVRGLQNLLQFVCKNGFEHHAAMTTARAAAALHESFTTYFGWETYWHK